MPAHCQPSTIDYQLVTSTLSDRHFRPFHAADDLGGQAFIAAGFFVFHLFAILEGAKPVASDAAEVDEDVLASALTRNPNPFLESNHLTVPIDMNVLP